MPELPEVETIARRLREDSPDHPPLLGRTVEGLDVRWPKTLAKPSRQEALITLAGQKIIALDRRGKFLQINLQQGTLIFHLRMSGDLALQSERAELPAHARLILALDSGWRLVFNDPRKFGRVWLVDDPKEILGALGPEPLDAQLTPERFYEMLHRRSRHLKPLLLDQHFLAGIGNIYSDEALNLAGLHPLENSARLTYARAEILLNAIRAVLQEGIARNGSSIDWVYRGGDFQNHFRVYGRTGEPCPKCQTPIEHITVGQRSTHFCPNCQKLEVTDEM